jgi:hypothetical protein
VNADDLTGLFAPDPAGLAPASNLLQGRLLTFNQSTGANTVQLGTTTLTNVPVLVTGTEVGLSAGNNVILMQIGNTYCILGRIATPGGTSFGSASQYQLAANNVATGFALTSTFATLTSVSFTTPPWANTVSVLSIFAYNAKNTFGADTDMTIRIKSDGETSSIVGSEMTGYGHNNSFNGVTVGHAIKHSVSGGYVVTVLGQGASAGWSATAQNSAYLSSIATFSKS